ncbi:MAG: polyphosphate polymerase domain-containing protein [Clostridiales bacterium]|jgi:hypothetical protein|nr:polyphosphate polymerase domain-containing protein [Clostridiales bacterium]
MAIEIFNRYEKKYRLDELTFTRLQKRLSDEMDLDEYSKKNGVYPIASLYYDTWDSQFIRASLMKPVYKEKLRLRAYGTPNAESKVYIEIKKKVKGIVNKRRSALKLSEAYAFLSGGGLPERRPTMNWQVLNEVAYMLEQNSLKPAVYLYYERRAFFGTGNTDLRVSFDTNIRARRVQLRLEQGTYGEQLLEEGQWLMEIKSARSMPLWLCRLLSEYKIYPSGFSKYGTEYTRTLDWSRNFAAAHADRRAIYV